MVHLRLTGVSEDGRTLLLVSDAGVEFTLDVDHRLRATLSRTGGGDQAGPGQLERQMNSTLRPRDIQARIRAGETPESVAQVAGTSVDKVMPYAAPVLAERAHIAQRAQRASIRRRPSEGTSGSSARTLGEAVGGHLRSRNVDPDTIAWDAWRREDGRWTLIGSYTTTSRVGAAHFSFDAPGNYVVADDDDAHWLLGEVADEPETQVAATGDDLSQARRRRLSAVAPEDLPLGEDAIELVAENPDAETAEARDEENAALGAEAPVEAYLDIDVTEQRKDGPDEAEHQSPAPARKAVKKSRGRASVPSWDEIMFGPSDGGRA